MHTQETRNIGDQLALLLEQGQAEGAYRKLFPILEERTPFRLLDLIGSRVGSQPTALVDPFLKQIAADRTEGGWVVIASALAQRINHHLEDALKQSRGYILQADIWYATDILGERVPGPALLAYFEPTLALLSDWREDSNPWVRRTVGVAIHFWTKRTHGAPQYTPQAQILLDFVEPMFSERDLEAVKGVGWGLKTIGRYYPDLLTAWLSQAIRQPHRALMLRKALTYLPFENRRRVLAQTP